MLVSVVAPAYDEEANVRPFFERSCAALEKTGYAFEVIIVDNGSRDGTLGVLKQIHAADKRLKHVSLSRNFGHQGGILAGLHYAEGDAVITMDADLQHPPEFIPVLLEKWEQGYQVVNTLKEVRGASTGFFRKIFDKLFYRVMQRLIGASMAQADFRLMDRKVVGDLIQLPESEKFLRGLIAWFGFRQTVIAYPVSDRIQGRSKFSALDLIGLAYHAITAFSTVPLKMLTLMGVLLMIPSFAYAMYVIGAWFMRPFLANPPLMPPGWATLTVIVIFIGSVQLLALGVIGEYIGRIYMESKGRPHFIVSESFESDDGAGDA